MFGSLQYRIYPIYKNFLKGKLIGKKMHYKPFLINSIILIIAATAFAIFDATLSLGQFSGLVFMLWTAYFCGAQFLVSMLYAALLAIKKHSSALSVALSGLVVPGVGILILYGISLLA
jgi:hypothetical protein